MKKRNSHMARAVDVVGGQAAMAAHLHVTQPTISEWVTGGSKVPLKRCPAIERLTRARAAKAGDERLVVRCAQLRPDFDWKALREFA